MKKYLILLIIILLATFSGNQISSLANDNDEKRIEMEKSFIVSDILFTTTLSLNSISFYKDIENPFNLTLTASYKENYNTNITINNIFIYKDFHPWGPCENNRIAEPCSSVSVH